MLEPFATETVRIWLSALAVGVPLTTTLVLGVLSFMVDVPSERLTHRTVMTAMFTSVLALLGLVAMLIVSGRPYLEVDFGPWFQVGGYRFELGFLLDELSLGFALTVATIGLLISRFAINYLHREEGYTRFFLLLCLAIAGLEVIALAASYDVLFLGWEVVGLCSITMVLFFHKRPGPVRAALQVLLSYRLADIGLLVGAVMLHHAAGTTAYEAVFDHGAWPGGAVHLDPATVTVVAVLLVLTSAGKAAQLPFSGWLPRAMEGPTPSSALFYGALSVHAGIFLLLRSAPLFDHSPAARLVLIAVGASTAAYAALVGRVQSDAKGQMAFATMAQLGVMLVEIGFGFITLAALHVVAHAFLRGFQLLRTPSVIADVRLIQAKLAGRPLPQENAIERALPISAARWLYRHSLDRFHLDRLGEVLVVGPATRLSQLFASADAAAVRWMVDGLEGTSLERRPAPPAVPPDPKSEQQGSRA